MKKTIIRKPQKDSKSPYETKQLGLLVRRSKLSEFLSPTRQKRIYLLLLSIFLGVAFSFVSVGLESGKSDLPYWVSYWAFIILSFPSFLLWQGYGLESLSKLGTIFTIFAIFMQSFWLYLTACSLSLLIKWKKVEQ